MKKRILTLISMTMAILLLVSCSSGKYAFSSSDSSTGTAQAPSYNKMSINSSVYPESEMTMDYYAEADYAMGDSNAYYDEGYDSPITGISDIVQVNVSLSEKIIYSAYASVETIHFDESLTELNNMITQFDAFVENSFVSGSDYATKYYGYNPYRNASFTIRVPRENFTSLTGALSALGHVTSLSTDATNVTEQYTDVESRLTVYRTEESRLLSMLEKCETVADMITIESTLSSVRYEIEYLTSRLKNLDNQVNYSSVSININEVEELTPTVQIRRTYGQQLTDGLKDTLRGVGNFFKSLLLFLFASSPVLAILIVIAVVVIVLYRRRRKHRKAQLESVEIAEPDDIEPK